MRFGRSQSSQFLSAVLQVAPFARHEVRVDLEPGQTSWPYVAMTMRLMDEFGLTPELIRTPEGEPKQIIIPQGGYAATNTPSSPTPATPPISWPPPPIHPGSKVTIEGLGKRSLQGDVGFADVLHRMGAGLVFGPDFITVTGPDRLEGIDVDLSAMPDTAQTLAVAAVFAEGPTTIRGLHTLRVKETDRVAALANELVKLGAEVSVEGDDLTIHPPEDGKVRPASIDTYDDHRMAMSFAVAGTRSAGVRIRDARVREQDLPGVFPGSGKAGAGGDVSGAAASEHVLDPEGVPASGSPAACSAQGRSTADSRGVRPVGPSRLPANGRRVAPDGTPAASFGNDNKRKAPA